MKRYRQVCLFWGLLQLCLLTLEAQTAGGPESTVKGASQDAEVSGISEDAPVITIEGLCEKSHSEKTGTAQCRTVITKGQFERAIDAVQPGMPARVRREFALDYVDFLMMARKAEEMGLDKGPAFEEQMKLARVQVLSRDLKQAMLQHASIISDKEIEDYYLSNSPKFEKAEVERIYIPKVQQPPSELEPVAADFEKQKRTVQSERAMKDEADLLHTRAMAGEDFASLQANAYSAAGIKSTLPAINMVIRRTSLPAAQASIMDLKVGDVSSVFADPNGYFIYKIKAKEILTLDQVRDEIIATLRTQKMQNEMRNIQESGRPLLEESYFVH